ncbi:MAG: Kelch repeat-containing protein [Gemmataceae bacterium]
MQPAAPLAFQWHLVASGGAGPGPRSRHGLVYDRKEGIAVLFGGLLGTEDLPADTWELRAGGWAPVSCRTRPPGRHRAAMTYDGRLGQSVLFGGQGVGWGFLSDTWTYSDQHWQRWRPGWFAARPSPRCGHAMAFDEAAGVTVLFGGVGPGDRALGDTWFFDDDGWRPTGGRSPSPRRYAAFAYHPVLRGCVLHGGSEDDRGRTMYGDSWLLRDGRWERLDALFRTAPRDDHGLAYHDAAGALVMSDGVTGPAGYFVHRPHGWLSADVRPTLPRCQCSPMAWDEGLQGLLMHGGEAHHGGPQSDATMLLRRSDVTSLMAPPRGQPGRWKVNGE